MALFRFKTRNPHRDRETDASRMHRLHQLLDEIRSEIDNEKNGLRNRYDKVTADAAFSQQALEDDRAGAEISSKIDELTEAMIRYTKRLASLDDQIDFVTELRDRIERFSQANTGEDASAKPAGAKQG